MNRLAEVSQKWGVTQDFVKESLQRLSPLVGDSVATEIALASRSENEFEVFLKSLSEVENPAQSVAMMFDEVNESPFSLNEWIDSIFILNEYSRTQRVAANFETYVGYIVCCGELVEAKPGEMPLIEVVSDMLKTHGFTGGFVS